MTPVIVYELYNANGNPNINSLLMRYDNSNYIRGLSELSAGRGIENDYYFNSGDGSMAVLSGDDAVLLYPQQEALVGPLTSSGDYYLDTQYYYMYDIAIDDVTREIESGLFPVTDTVLTLEYPLMTGDGLSINLVLQEEPKRQLKIGGYVTADQFKRLEPIIQKTVMEYIQEVQDALS